MLFAEKISFPKGRALPAVRGDPAPRSGMDSRHDKKLAAHALTWLLQNNGGFMDVYLLTMFIILNLIIFAVLGATAFAARKNAVATYMWLGEAMDCAVQAANMEGTFDNSPIHTDLVRQYFDAVFSDMTGTSASGDSFTPLSGSPYPGPIRLTEFTPVNVGDPVPGGSARQPGYLVSVVVPVLDIKLPLIGHQYLEVPMRYFSVLKTTSLSN